MGTENPVNVDTVGLWVDPADLPLCRIEMDEKEARNADG
jgi:hypothetical protein